MLIRKKMMLMRTTLISNAVIYRDSFLAIYPDSRQKIKRLLI